MAASPQPYRAAAAAALAGILVGSGIVATRFVIDQTAPASLAFLRYLIGVACLLPPLLLARRVRFARRDLLPIGLLGIVQFGILIALLNYGVQFIPSARAALIFASFPLLTMLLAAGLGTERLTWPKSLGVLLTIAGVALALGEKAILPGGPGGPGTGGDASWIGELAVLASAFCGALCSVLYRPYLQRYPALPVSFLAMLASVGFLALLAAWEGFFAAPPQFTSGGWLAVAFIGVSSGIGYYCWLWALNHASPTRVTVFLALSPISATAFGALLLSEDISLLFLLALACVALGLGCATLWPGRDETEARRAP